jgi:hydrogenase/urease accessory protein HupE
MIALLRRVAIGVLLCLPLMAHAHLSPAGFGAIRLVGDSAYATISVPVAALAGFDDNRDGLASPLEIDRHRGMLSLQMSALMEFRSAGVAGKLLFEDMVVSHPGETGIAGEKHIIVMRRYQWSQPVESISATVRLFHADATRDETLALRVIKGKDSQLALLKRGRESHDYFAGNWTVFRYFFDLGFEHIMLGPDHLLFLLTVLVVGAGWRYWLTVVTSFTVAHSITLALTALGYISTPAAIIEPLIAASIVVLGLDNLRKREGLPRFRGVLVFGCGLLHGMGIAGALVEMGLADGNRAISLLAFNAGVEAGQLLVVGAGLAVLALAGNRMRPVLVKYGSMLAAAVGAFWLVQRTLV